MKSKIIPLASCLLLAPVCARAAAPLDPVDVERRIERAALRGDLDAAQAAAAEIDAALATDAQAPALHYLRGFACYAAGAALRARQDTAGAIAQFEEADDILGRVHDPLWAGEAAGLDSAVCSALIGLKGGTSGMVLGPKCGELLIQAGKGAGAQSPRTLMFRGNSLLYTPLQWGGNPATGAKLLQQAADAFTKQDPTAPGPHWGQAEALASLGLARQKTGDLEAARAAWTQALAIEPDYAWVKFVLLPSLPAPPG